jgi:pimeloyl-ACP methyl ester carboxylesterase
VSILGLLLLALAVWIAMPASTPPILDAGGNPVPGGIAELTTAHIGGHDQALLIRAHSADNPVLLYLSGGPGQSSLPWPRVVFDDLARDFVVVAWDQRGTGKSYAALDPTSTLTLDRAIADTVEVSEYLRERFDEAKIYLLGESYGTTLAVLAAQQRPDLYHAIIGSGQMVSQRETDRRLYYDVLDYASRTGDEALAAKMHAYGEPPYADLYAYAFVMGYYEALYKPYTPPAAFIEKAEQAALGPWNVLGSEYNLVEKVNVFRGFLDVAAIMYPQLHGLDFRRDVPRLETPVYVLDGAAELASRRDLALEWFDLVEAPIKRLVTYENAAHAPAFEQFEAFGQLMRETVLPETYTNN